MQVVSAFPRAVVEDADMGIRLADGCRLSARVWMPQHASANPVPAILEFLPYRKRDGTIVRDALTHPWFAGHGYACLRVDMRGNGDSEGLMDDEYSPQELSDAREVIAWIAAQPWCTGKVGMMGISWGGFNSLQVASLQTPALKAIITLCSTVDRFADDIHYKGGCLLGENLGWGATMWAYSSRPPDPALRPDWRGMWLERLAAEPFLPALWLGHQRRDAYWRHGSVCEDFDAIGAKVLAIGGWGDAYKNAVPQLVEHAGAKGIIGPWVHKYPHFAVPAPRIGFLDEGLRWWDRWLKGIETGVEDDPACRFYLMDGVRPATWYDHRPGRWIAEPSWPGPNISVTTLAFGPGSMGAAPAPFAVTVASPQDCGMDGGEYCAIWLGPEMPGDQRRDDALSATFDSDALTEAADIVGAPVVRLRLSSDRPVAQIAVRLNHIHPDGAATRITWGVLNLTHSADHAEAAALVPGRMIEVAVALDHIAYRVPAGHRIRVAVSSAYWPMIWPSPEAATLRLTAGALDLPLRRAGGPGSGGPDDEVSFPPAATAPPLALREIRPAAHVRRTEIDRQSGIVSLIIEDDFGEAENPETGLTTGSIARERWDIHPDDPLSARATIHWTETMARGDWRVRTEAHCTMSCDATHFHLGARIEAWEGEAMIYTREERDSIRRDHL